MDRFSRSTRLRACALLLPVVTALVVTVPASGKVPDPRNSRTDPVLVGTSSGAFVQGVGETASPGFDITVREVNNGPVAFQVVTLRLNSPHLAFLETQNQGVGVECANRSISVVTDQAGHACFGARIAGFDNDPEAITVLAEGVVIAHVPARSTDLWGMDGVTDLNDLRVLREGFFSPQGAGPELDFNLDGRVDAADLLLFRDEYFRLAGASPCP